MHRYWNLQSDNCKCRFSYVFFSQTYKRLLIKYLKVDYIHPTLDMKMFVLLLLRRAQGTPTWIPKQGGLESSDQILSSYMAKLR